MPTRDYAARTRRNVAEADAVLILCRGKVPSFGGTRLTLDLANQMKKEHIWSLDLTRDRVTLRVLFEMWTSAFGVLDDVLPPVEKLMIAGPRESKQRGIQRQTREFLIDVLGSLKEKR